MRKILLSLCLFLSISSSMFAYEVPKNEEYYKAQIQNQRLTYNISGLFNAIHKKNAKAVELYMKAGFDPNETYMGTPLAMYALNTKQTESFIVLLNYGADPETTVPPMFVSAKAQNLLSYAIKRKSSEAVEALIEHKVDVNKKFNDEIPLNYALETKQNRIVELLLKAGAKPDEKTMKLVKNSKDEYIQDLFADYIKADEK